MIGKVAVAALALACALDGTALAARPAVPLDMATGHVAGAPGSAPAVTEKPGQILASRVLNSIVREKNGAAVANIADLIIDRRRAAVTLAVLKPAGSTSFKNGRPTVAWTSLHFVPTPAPHFVTALSPKALSAGTSAKSFEQKAGGSSAYYDATTDLLGQQAVGPHGQDAGKINDLVFDIKSGRMIALVVHTGGLIEVGANDHAIAWGAARPSGKKPVRFALSQKQIESAPVTNAISPLPTPIHKNTAAPHVMRRDQTGNLSGTAILGPANRR